ncbi:MAG: hypothetical protein JXB49_17560 [Bacteroidales bacterium]|nr:hypothetical protein [Bacteroidales bacterium]
MKKTIFLVLLAFFIANSKAQNQVENRDNRKVIEIDTLDVKMNKLINLNEDLNSRDVSFNNNEKFWRQGKIYTLTNDTLIGEIKTIAYTEGLATIEVFYRKDENSKKTKYRADKVLGYSSNNRDYFTKKFSNYPPLFIERLEKGALNLYFVKFNQSLNFGAWTRTRTYFYIEVNDSLQEMLSGPVPNNPKEFKEFINDFICDYPALFTKVQNDIYNENHIREIIQLYNDIKRTE